MGVSATRELVRANSQLSYQVRGKGHSRGRRDAGILKGIASDEGAGCSVFGAGRTTRNRTALPHPSSSRRLRSTQPVTCYPRGQAKSYDARTLPRVASSRYTKV